MRPQNTPGFRGTPEDRFWRKVQISPNGCWLWTGSIREGYGAFWPGGSRNAESMIAAHLWAYRRYVGPVPAGMELDHTCRNRACINPHHLEPVTHKVNCLRGNGQSAINARKKHCKRGHALTGDNLRLGSKGERFCKACANIRQRALRAKRSDPA